MSLSTQTTYPSPEKRVLSTNYLSGSDFDFLKTEQPDLITEEIERFGNRTIGGFLDKFTAEFASASDNIKWSEQGRLHLKFKGGSSDAAAAADSAVITFTGTEAEALRVGQNVHLHSAADGLKNKAIVTGVAINGGNTEVSVSYYEGGGQTFGSAATDLVLFVFGSEFKKGTEGMVGSIEPTEEVFENTMSISKDHYEVSGSDMAQIGWIEVAAEDGTTGHYWFLKGKAETRIRFEDYVETKCLEGSLAETGSGAAALGYKGTEGLFDSVKNRGQVWAGANPDSIADFDAIIDRLDAEGQIQENALFVNRGFSANIDDMLAELSSGAQGGTAYGLFDNDENMALNLGFKGFRRSGYDFYKSDFKYLNDSQMRGGVTGGINGILIPASTTSVYDQSLGKNISRPFLHVRYRASEHDNRKMDSYVLGGRGSNRTSSLDAMQVEFLDERCMCTLAANNFMLFEGA